MVLSDYELERQVRTVFDLNAHFCCRDRPAWTSFLFFLQQVDIIQKSSSNSYLQRRIQENKARMAQMGLTQVNF